ncbi:MAG TPA: hypothetical protein PLN69_12040 [bacterium]|nr:hypothetical protein [bacterium]
MAKRAVVAEELVQEPSKRSFLWLWILLAVIGVILLISVLHLSGALTGPEQALYRSTKDVPVVSFFTGALYQEDWEEVLSQDQIIDVKQLRIKLEQQTTEIASLKKAAEQLPAIAGDLSAIQENLEKINKDIKDMKEGDFEVTATVASPAAAVAAAGTSVTSAAVTTTASQGDNFRLLSKVFEKLPADTAVDIMNNLSDDEKVKILSGMKEGTMADLLGAFDPAKSAQLARMLASGK